MNNKKWYEILDKAYGVDWELGKGFQWLNMVRWDTLCIEEMQEVITLFESRQSLLHLTGQQVKYAVDRYGLRQVAERVERELGSRHRVHTMSLKTEGVTC